jgi:hypothetical protein
MYTFSIDYTCKYQLSFADNYKWSTCGKCYNAKTGRLIKQVIKGGCIGYVIQGKFYSLKKLRTKLELIPTKDDCPF